MTNPDECQASAKKLLCSLLAVSFTSIELSKPWKHTIVAIGGAPALQLLAVVCMRQHHGGNSRGDGRRGGHKGGSQAEEAAA